MPNPTPQQTMSCSSMASLSPHLPIPLFITLLFTSINANSLQQSNPAACPSFDCGNGVTISYPFWLQHQNDQSEYCGYPGFNLSCAGQAPTLCLSGDIYEVTTLNYSENTITIAYVDLKEGNCPRASHDVALNSSLFNYTVDDKMLRFFYNCTLYPPALPFIACLQFGDKRSFVFVVGAIPEFDWHRYCESVVTVPVMEKTIDGRMVNGFGRAMRDGFKLTWRPDGVCQSCEATGGVCGYRRNLHQNFFCLCTDGRHSVNCHDKGAVPIKFEPNLAAKGALIFGGLIIAATIFFFIRRKKVSSHKPVFTRIPNSGK